ncbi:putative CCR4-associated factor 1-like protein 9-like isoform 1 [Hibiscus syriacus]|uniref:CCR4-associated factor 1-like protein 9-like isoform 1 n=1 Tax=Hibiscus syriacus TaxID=106335 RepID=A0A6A2YT01_HIBSY|nr:putative CCR4-associated factor 1-like protein 9-like isoform 1 [Hibiscus syriacus]
MSPSPKVELKLKLSPPNPGPQVIVSPDTSEMSPGSSCVTSESLSDSTMRNPNTPEGKSMMVMGCPRCLMYVMGAFGSGNLGLSGGMECHSLVWIATFPTPGNPLFPTPGNLLFPTVVFWGLITGNVILPSLRAKSVGAGERKLVKERSKEDHLHVDKDMFVTSAYKK